MMLTSRQILALITAAPTGVQKGRVQALVPRNPYRPDGPSKGQQALLQDLLAAPVRPTASSYEHPTARAVSRTHGAPLDQSELLWLQRLPADPTQVSHADARVLAGMAASLPMNTPERRVVDQSWLPMRELHDANVARLHAEAANVALPPVPSSALGALADAVRAENTTLLPEEAIGRAETMLSEALEGRRRQHQGDIDAATRRVEELDAAIADRTSTVRVTTPEQVEIRPVDDGRD